MELKVEETFYKDGIYEFKGTCYVSNSLVLQSVHGEDVYLMEARKHLANVRAKRFPTFMMGSLLVNHVQNFKEQAWEVTWVIAVPSEFVVDNEEDLLWIT